MKDDDKMPKAGKERAGWFSVEPEKISLNPVIRPTGLDNPFRQVK